MTNALRVSKSLIDYRVQRIHVECVVRCNHASLTQWKYQMTNATKKPTLATRATVKRAAAKRTAPKRTAVKRATVNAKTKTTLKTPETFTASELAKSHNMQSKTLRARIRRNAEFFADKYANVERNAGEHVLFLTKHRAAIDAFLTA